MTASNEAVFSGQTQILPAFQSAFPRPLRQEDFRGNHALLAIEGLKIWPIGHQTAIARAVDADFAPARPDPFGLFVSQLVMLTGFHPNRMFTRS